MSPSPQARSTKPKSSVRARLAERKTRRQSSENPSSLIVKKKEKKTKAARSEKPKETNEEVVIEKVVEAREEHATAVKSSGKHPKTKVAKAKANVKKAKTIAQSDGGDANSANASARIEGEPGAATVNKSVGKQIEKRDRRQSPRTMKQKGVQGKDDTAVQSDAASKATIVNRFSLNLNEQPQKKGKKSKAKPASNVQPGDGREGRDSAEANEETDSPDVVFNKRMTKDKLSLLARSPVSRLVPEKEKDAAAQQVYGKDAKFSTHVKRKADEVDEVIPLDSTLPPIKKSKSDNADAKSVDPVELAARRKERRKLKRKLRQQRALQAQEDEETERGVIYLGHVPHGFYEKQMRGYFSQYGKVTRLRLSRSKKTARSRGYAFVEFADVEIAKKAAESMDGYLMHGQKLVAKIVPKERLHPKTFKGAKKQEFKKITLSEIERVHLIRRSRDPLKLAQRSKGVQKKLKARKGRLEKIGLKYDFPEVMPNM